MTNNQLKRYFERRPKADTLFLIGNLVFVDLDKATTYAQQQKLEVETKIREEVMANSNKGDQEGGQNIADAEVRMTAEAVLLGTVLDENTDYKLAGKLVRDLSLQTNGKSKEDYLVALSAEKERLIQNSSSDESSTDQTKTAE